MMLNKNSNITKISIVIIVAIGLIFIGYSIKANYSELQKYALDLNIMKLFIAILFTLIMLYSKSLVHLNLIDKKLVHDVGKNKAIFSYSISQIVKYIPGKVIGIATQALHLTGKITNESIWKANLTQYILTNYYSALVLLVLFIVYYFSMPWLLILLIPLSYTTVLIIRFQIINRIFRIIIKFLKIKKISIQNVKDKNMKDWHILFLLILEWVFYFFCWMFLSPSSFTYTEAILFGSTYALASLIGTIILIMPSGIIIREAAFILIGSYFGFSSDVLIIYSIISRLVFTFSDILFCFILYVYILTRSTFLHEKLTK